MEGVGLEGLSKKNFYKTGNKGATTATLGDRVWYHSDEDGWVSYVAAARRH